MMNRRFIEDSFPVKEVGEEGASGKSIHQGNISTFHTWWARRPLAVSRSTTYAALTLAPSNIEEWAQRRNYLVQIAHRANEFGSKRLETAQKEILSTYEGNPPKVFDPFAGGGSYPLEALRLGCDTYANDYNPVAVLILKALLEYPIRFRSHQINAVLDGSPKQETFSSLLDQRQAEQGTSSSLTRAVRHWSAWVLEETKKQLAEFYPKSPNGDVAVGYLWARTIPCQNPDCHVDIPLMRQYWLAKRDKKRIALYPDNSSGRTVFRVVGDGYNSWPNDCDPEKGTVSRAVAICPTCGGVVDDKTTRRLFKERQTGHRLMAVVTHYPKRPGKLYRIPTSEDNQAFEQARRTLEAKRANLLLQWGLDPVPDEPFPNDVKMITEPLGSAQNYSFRTWGELFNERQQLTLLTLCEQVRRAYDQMVSDGETPDFATAVATYLGITLDWLADKMSSLTRWHVTREIVTGTFGRQALQMVWDYFEVNPFSGVTSGWDAASRWVIDVLDLCCRITPGSLTVPTVTQFSATSLPYGDNFFDAVLTDPPYYDNIPYSYLSDFFYVWLKRSVGHIHPDLFSTPLTPKANEIVAYAFSEGVVYDGKQRFEGMLSQAFGEIQRVLKPNGIAVIVYAHKSLAGWETVINALLDSGMVVTAAWPINTEMKARVNANETASLASSIYVVARKIVRQPTGFYNEVRDELRQHLNAKLQRLWEEGISGADFFIAAIGSAIEIFGKYEQVLDYEGNVVRADRLLEDVRTIATDYAVHQILHDGFAGEISDLTRFYILWRWEYGEARVPFDEARKLAQSCGLDISREWGRGFVKKDKEFVQVLGPQARKLEGHETSHEMIDVLHRVLLLWEKSQRAEMVSVLAASGYGASEAFYRVAQAISETLPNESKEKKLLDGFLAGRGRVQDEVEQVVHRPTLWQE